jgi:hypothetical protein
MLKVPVEFNPDERALLSWLEKNVKPDGCLAVWDAVLIRELHLESEPNRFFAAKMRLKAAGALDFFTDGAGQQVLRLYIRPTERMIFTCIPLACERDVKKLVAAHRARHRGTDTRPVEVRAEKKSPDLAKRQEAGMGRMGLKPRPGQQYTPMPIRHGTAHGIPAKPLRPPINKSAVGR